MHRIDIWRLRASLDARRYRDAVVVASPLGGWLMLRKVMLGAR